MPGVGYGMTVVVGESVGDTRFAARPADFAVSARTAREHVLPSPALRGRGLIGGVSRSAPALTTEPNGSEPVFSPTGSVSQPRLTLGKTKTWIKENR